MSVSCDGHADVYHEDTAKARKEHRCDACQEAIPRGVEYWRIRIIYEGRVDSHKRCNRCQAIHEHLRGLMAGYDEEWPDERLSCGHEYSDHWGVEPPPEIAALAFALPGDGPEVIRAMLEGVGRG